MVMVMVMMVVVVVVVMKMGGARMRTVYPSIFRSTTMVVVMRKAM
jgi:hypothetical protein